METQHTAPKEEKKQSRLFLYLFLLMTVACGIFAWLYWIQKNETQEVTTENVQITQESEEVKRDLQQLQTDYDALKTDDESIKKEIEEKKALIEVLQKEAEKHKNDAWIISKLKKETKTLREIMQHFVVEIDSLNTMNKTLIAQKDSVTTELSSEKQKSATLLTEKDKLYKVGSIIKASGMTVTAMNVKGKNKLDETSKAKKTDKIKIAFKLGENKIAPKGPRTIYVRIVTPDGKEWCDSPDADHMFTFGNSKGFYAMKKSLQYENEDISVEMFIRKKENQELLPGKYMVEVNMDNATIGSTTLVLE
jgi:hypothetical protein